MIVLAQVILKMTRYDIPAGMILQIRNPALSPIFWEGGITAMEFPGPEIPEFSRPEICFRRIRMLYYISYGLLT